MATAFSFREMPSASSLLSGYASLAGTLMLLRSMANELIPQKIRDYLFSFFDYLFTPPSTRLTFLIDESVGMHSNKVFEAAEIYLGTKIGPSTDRLKISKIPRQKNLTIKIEKGVKITDSFEGMELQWMLKCTDSNDRAEKHFFELTFDKRYRDKVLHIYLPHILSESEEIKQREKAIKLYTRDICSYSIEEQWGSVNLEHPSTFETLAMDPDQKKKIIEDLDRFVKRREFYKRVGKAWKRGYLLYGPPGTGKSSLIAAMANYLKFDIYDLELSRLYSNSDLRRILVSTSNRSIIVIEDIDCSVEFENRQNQKGAAAWCGGEFAKRQKQKEAAAPSTKLTLSGLLNFMDGLWSSCGDERIILFTTNHKDQLDPALLRSGRMDMHIHMSYCTFNGFKVLASNYLGIHGHHPLFEEIERLLENGEVTPAEVAEELMKSDNVDVALGELILLLEQKKIKTNILTTKRKIEPRREEEKTDSREQ